MPGEEGRRVETALRLPDGSVPDLYLVDMDGTLVSTSSEKLLLARLATGGVVGPARLFAFAAGYLLHPLRTLEEGKGWNRRYLKGLEPAVVRAEAAACAEILLKRHLRRWTVESVASLASLGCRAVMLTASLRPLALGVASGVGIEEVHASVPEVYRGRCTGGLSGTRPWGRSKLRLARDICRAAGTTLERCAAAGDSYGDRFLLEECGLPVAVCPGRRLEKTAKRNGWIVIPGKHTKWA